MGVKITSRVQFFFLFAFIFVVLMPLSAPFLLLLSFVLGGLAVFCAEGWNRGIYAGFSLFYFALAAAETWHGIAKEWVADNKERELREKLQRRVDAVSKERQAERK